MAAIPKPIVICAPLPRRLDLIFTPDKLAAPGTKAADREPGREQTARLGGPFESDVQTGMIPTCEPQVKAVRVLNSFGG